MDGRRPPHRSGTPGAGGGHGRRGTIIPADSLTGRERQYLASIIRQVWRACRAFATVVVEEGPGEAATTLRDLDEWAQEQRRRCASRGAGRPPHVGSRALSVARVLLADISVFCRALVAELEAAEGRAAEEASLQLIERFLDWTSLMGRELGLARNLRPRSLRFER